MNFMTIKSAIKQQSLSYLSSSIWVFETKKQRRNPKLY